MLSSAAGEQTAERNVMLAYDDSHRLTSTNDDLVGIDYRYDAVGRLSQHTTEFKDHDGDALFSKTLTHAYHNNNQPRLCTNAQGQASQYLYDKAGRLTQISFTDLGSLTWDAYVGHLPTQITHSGNVTRTLGYDGLARLNRINVQNNADNVLLDYQYQYDNANNITGQRQQSGLTSATNDGSSPQRLRDHAYQYDQADRLTQVDVNQGQTLTQYAYDDNSNRISQLVNGQSTTYAHNGNHELIEQAQVINAQISHNQAHTYDANGALTSDGQRQYTYNAGIIGVRVTFPRLLMSVELMM